MNALSPSVQTGGLYRALLWLVAISAAGALVYGFASTNLFSTPTWSATGMARFLTYTRIFALVYAVLALMLRRYIGLAIALPVVAFTMRGTGAAAFGSVLLLWISCALLGRWLFRTRNWALGFLGGLCTWALAIALLAQVKVHYALVYMAVLVLVIVLRWRDLIALSADLRDAFGPRAAVRWPALLGLGLFLYAFLAQWLLVWKPESGGDALAMHLAIALDFANNHLFTFDYHQYIWALAPMGADFCYAAAAVLGGEYAARLLNLVMFGCVAYFIFQASQRWLPTGAAYLVAALFVSAPLAHLVTGSMFVENFTGALAVGALYALWEFYERRSAHALCLATFLLGSGIGWKMGGLAVAAGLLPFLILAVVRARRTPASLRWPAMVAALGLFAFPALYPYSKAYILTGNPFFPFGNPIFSSPLIEDYLVDYRYQEPLTWRTLFDITFNTDAYYEGQDGSFAFQYLFLIPLLFVLFRKLRTFEERSAAAGGLIAALVIAVSQPNARYFYPALPILMIGGAAVVGVLRSLDRPLFQASVATLTIIVGLNLWFLPTSGWYHRDFYLRPLFAERGRLEYMRATSPVRETVPFLNGTTGGVLFVQHSDIAGVRQPVFSNHWHNLPFRKLTESARSAREFFGIVRQSGIEHFVGPTSVNRSDKNDSALLEFLDVCGEPEFETGSYSVRRIAADCDSKLAEAAPRFSSHIFPPGKYDDNDPRLKYLGRWDPFRDRFDEAHAHTVSFSHRKDAEVRLEFEGSAFVYGYTKAFNRGRGEIWIDGKRAGVLDQYSPEVQWQSTIRYPTSGPGRHSVAIRVTGEKHPDSKAAYVDFDFFVIEP